MCLYCLWRNFAAYCVVWSISQLVEPQFRLNLFCSYSRGLLLKILIWNVVCCGCVVFWVVYCGFYRIVLVFVVIVYFLWLCAWVWGRSVCGFVIVVFTGFCCGCLHWFNCEWICFGCVCGFVVVVLVDLLCLCMWFFLWLFALV